MLKQNRLFSSFIFSMRVFQSQFYERPLFNGCESLILCDPMMHKKQIYQRAIVSEPLLPVHIRSVIRPVIHHDDCKIRSIPLRWLPMISETLHKVTNDRQLIHTQWTSKSVCNNRRKQPKLSIHNFVLPYFYFSCDI